jgi:hypothetical protein
METVQMQETRDQIRFLTEIGPQESFIFSFEFASAVYFD